MKQNIASDLTSLTCVACRPTSVPVSKQELRTLITQLPRWKVDKDNKDNIEQLTRVFVFKNYQQALQFTHQVAELAEREGHHPAILLEWGKVTVAWWTHAINGLHQNDFICAAKTDCIGC
jgi:4a-hydroxytetrahydrobiopterin dehydratase